MIHLEDKETFPELFVLAFRLIEMNNTMIWMRSFTELFVGNPSSPIKILKANVASIEDNPLNNYRNFLVQSRFTENYVIRFS